jgi:3-dehydroquinate synthase
LLAVDANLHSTHGIAAKISLQRAHCEPVSVSLIAQETSKTLAAAQEVYNSMIAARLERQSPVIALGGGIVGDVVGFAAATYLRGVPLIHVPTTLLAMVDAAIGGKTGVNVLMPDGSLGKNLVGSFWQPRAVIIDPETLCTLDQRELRCGLAECVKHGMIADASLISFIHGNAAHILGVDLNVMTELIHRSASIKASIVQADERESGRRAMLNFGHTFGHAFESQVHLGLKHGEAVAVGIAAAMQVSVVTNRMSDPERQAIIKVLNTLGLPIRLPAAVSMSPVLAAMGHDKKIINNRLRLVLPRGIGAAEIVNDVPPSLIEAALIHVGCVA